MKPVVGVMPLWDDEKESMWMLPGYMEGIREAGGIPVMFPLTIDEGEIEELMNMVDGVLMTGGHDVSPELYEEVPLDNVVSCKLRDAMECIVLDMALKKDKSVLGICRGIQFINVALGGDLYQDIPSQYPSETDHHQSPPYNVPVHKVIIMEDSPLYNILNKTELMVNSYHHQAVKMLSDKLTAMAYSEDGLIEAVCDSEQRFLWAVQWHPEFNYKESVESKLIFRAFVDSMK